MFFRKVVPGSASRLTIVDHRESYGRHILQKAIKNKQIMNCVDIGCGDGSDLSIISAHNAQTKLYGIDFGDWNAQKLKKLNIIPLYANIEIEKLPFDDNSIDFIIANQVIEHTKEIFWINHEIFRCLKVGGFLYLGVPNILSFHNRILMAVGYHPTQNKLTSAHVRTFSRKDVYGFYKNIGAGFCKIDGFWGSQFYPFPKRIARMLSFLMPTFSFSIFFLIRKTAEYHKEFIEWPEKAHLETNYFIG